MARPRGIRRFLHLPRSAARIRADVDEELRFDIEMRASDLVRQGVPHDAAQARAVAEFGDLEATRRYCEETDMASEAQISRATVLSDLRADLAITWRMMRRTPAFALVVGTTLALGIGANTTVFSVVKRVLITPLPFRAPDRLYRMYTAPSSVDGDNDKLSAVEIMALADARSLAGVTEFGNYGGMTFTDGRTAEPWGTVQVGPNFFEVFGIRPALGRQFTDEDFGPNGARGVIITHQLWQRVFGGDPGVVGRRVQLNNGDLTIVGVLPESFVGPTFTADALLPLPFANILRSSPRNVRARVLRAVVRTRDGVSEAALNAELATLGQRVRAQYPEIKNGGVFRPVSLHAAMVGNAKTVLLLVMAGALLVLVITCANIAGLFLSRGAARRRELGVRAALGAGRSRLVRQMLTESALYGLGGGAAGIALAVVMTRVFVGLAGSTLPQLGEIRLDGFSLAFAATIAILCGLAVGVAPAVAATRVDLREALGDTGNRGASTGVAGVRGRRALVAAQLAVAVVLLVGAGLLLRTFTALTRTPLGYAVDTRTLTFRVNLPSARYPDTSSRAALVAALVGRVRSLPGVRAVGYTAVAPWNGGMMSVGFRVEGRQVDPSAVPNVQYATASDELFLASSTPLRAGRAFTSADRVGAPSVAIISESVARRFWPNGGMVGARIRLGTGAPGDDGVPLEVVGVVGDVRQTVLGDIVPTVYVSERQWSGRGGEFVVRAADDASALIPGIKSILHELDPELPLIFPRTMRQVLDATIARQHLAMMLMASFAVLAVVLAALGVYSVMAYSVIGRTREFGIRAALGAERWSIVGLVLRQGATTTVVGVAVGLLAAAVASKYVASLLVGVTARDVPTFTLSALTLVLVAAVACLLPARRATRVEPVEALRAD
ncbi:MAG TPA: ABC transporter permease [Gemmatimonadaceae bacterium]|nr:ABC transporter permease [Gemmatimonadaceae bacterium]HVE35547.1 ABC transporter permease [Gemmatimonadaceae bacterium]